MAVAGAMQAMGATYANDHGAGGGGGGGGRDDAEWIRKMMEHGRMKSKVFSAPVVEVVDDPDDPGWHYRGDGKIVYTRFPGDNVVTDRSGAHGIYATLYISLPPNPHLRIDSSAFCVEFI